MTCSSDPGSVSNTGVPTPVLRHCEYTLSVLSLSMSALIRGFASLEGSNGRRRGAELADRRARPQGGAHRRHDPLLRPRGAVGPADKARPESLLRARPPRAPGAHLPATGPALL